MVPTEYHPVRTAMMGNVRNRRIRSIDVAPDMADWSMPRPSEEWKPRFLSHDDALIAPTRELFRWRGGIIQEEAGGRPHGQCVAAMDRLCVFEDMLASMKTDGRPIYDLSEHLQEFASRLPAALERGREFSWDFFGSIYIHFGETGIRAMGERSVTGVYAHARCIPGGTTFGELHFTGADPNWHRTHEIGFYDTLLTHQDVAVITYFIDIDENVSVDVPDDDVFYGNEANACELLPLVKLGMDISLEWNAGIDPFCRKELIHGGAGLGPEYSVIEVLAPSPQFAFTVSRTPLLPENESARHASLPGHPSSGTCGPRP